MSKSNTVFVCSNCGYESAKWLGKCPACNEWNTFYEEKVLSSSNNSLSANGGNKVKAMPRKLKGRLCVL